jgi:phosphohistidine phosphatase SixA
MKYLVIIRHGDYVEEGRLSGNGRRQIEAIAEVLRPLAAGGRAQVISSTAIRAEESAEIIGAILALPVETNEILWSEEDHPEDFAALLELIRNRQDKADCLILVTHLEYTLSFPSYFAKREWRVEVPALGIQKGEGVVLCLADKTYKIIGKKEDLGHEYGRRT